MPEFNTTPGFGAACKWTHTATGRPTNAFDVRSPGLQTAVPTWISNDPAAFKPESNIESALPSGS